MLSLWSFQIVGRGRLHLPVVRMFFVNLRSPNYHITDAQLSRFNQFFACDRLHGPQK